jgi:hypothetical protein
MRQRHLDSARRLQRGQNERDPHRRDDTGGGPQGTATIVQAMRDDRHGTAPVAGGAAR